MNRPPSFLGLPAHECRPMTDEESELFFAVGMAGIEDRTPLTFESELFKLGDQVALAARATVLRRLEIAGVSVTAPALLGMAILSRGVGDFVLFAYFALDIARRDRKTLIDFEALSFAMPHGVPSDAAKQRIWAAQKGFNGCDDNWLDTSEAWTLEAVPT